MGVNDADRKARIRAYKETPLQAGLYRVRNTASGACLIGSTHDLPGKLNGQRFQLEMGSHPDHELQADWNTLGPGTFELDVLDRLEPKGQSAEELAEDLKLLRDLWLERLREAGVPLYRQSERG